MKDYSESIAYMRQEMVKQTESHHKPYLDAITAMESKNPTKAEHTKDYVVCPSCGKVFMHRNLTEKKQRDPNMRCLRSVYGVGERR